MSSTSSLKSHFSSLAPAPLSATITDSTGHVILASSGSAAASSSSSSHQSAALSQAFISAHDTASRMGLGEPLRVSIATRHGLVVVQTGEAVQGEMVVGTVVAPEEREAEARVASWGVHEVVGRVARVVGEGRREG
ncbi:hypothetical protein FN846DRAFT_933194 [Sphaerosporella brunnea]|uniref:Roadblock/LAMTOR2 domain-containing protein n=1 Tax=Sphaerosporella brunnea TaxID=1250544 RepID=A0A5J5F789_9PEZI|nr:hypothetical protein FN846DRAFT_933194 [Sphaerosporella brunnea]